MPGPACPLLSGCPRGWAEGSDPQALSQQIVMAMEACPAWKKAGMGSCSINRQFLFHEQTALQVETDVRGSSSANKQWRRKQAPNPRQGAARTGPQDSRFSGSDFPDRAHFRPYSCWKWVPGRRAWMRCTANIAHHRREPIQLLSFGGFQAVGGPRQRGVPWNHLRTALCKTCATKSSRDWKPSLQIPCWPTAGRSSHRSSSRRYGDWASVSI